MGERRELVVDGVTLQVEVTRKRVKNVNARLRGDRLMISAPVHLSARELGEAVGVLARRLVRRTRARTVNAEDDAAELARRVARRFPEPPKVERVLFVTTQTGRWGSYSAATGTIRLHAGLRALPRWVLEAVVAHELAHVFHADHGPAFRSLLRAACPDAEKADAFLAGVSFVARRWDRLPPVERALLAGSDDAGSEPSEACGKT